MTSIYVIRHSQAEGNLYRMMQGHWDGNVTPRGRAQIEKLSGRFRDVHLDAVYSSDLRRAVMTAEGVARGKSLPIRTDCRIREIDLGPWQSEFFGNSEHADPEGARLFMFDSENWSMDGAETFDQVKKRAYAALEDIAKAHDGETVAVISHGVTIRCLLSEINQVPLSDIANCPICKNTAVARFIYDGGTFTCEYFNDISHLGKEDEYHWWKTEDLRDEIVKAEDIELFYKNCYRDAWAFAHNGDLSRFNPGSYYRVAKRHTIYKLLSGDDPVGLVEMSDVHKKDGIGWISLLYLIPEYRGKGYGAQALGRAVRYCIDNGFDAIRLHCAAENTIALKFYEKHGFEVISTESGASGPLLLLERKN